MNLKELRAYVASNEYGAELALQHSMRLLEELEPDHGLYEGNERTA